MALDYRPFTIGKWTVKRWRLGPSCRINPRHRGGLPDFLPQYRSTLKVLKTQRRDANVSKLNVLFALAEQARTSLKRRTLESREISPATMTENLIRMIFEDCTRRSPPCFYTICRLAMLSSLSCV